MAVTPKSTEVLHKRIEVALFIWLWCAISSAIYFQEFALWGIFLYFCQLVLSFIFQPSLFFFLPLIVAFDEDFDAERLENHDARAEVFLLAQSPDCEFTEVNPFRCY